MRNIKDPCLHLPCHSRQTRGWQQSAWPERKSVQMQHTETDIEMSRIFPTKNVLFITQLPHYYTLLTTTKQILCWQKAPQQPNMDTIRTKAPKTIKVKDRPLARSPTFRAPKDNCCNRGRIWSLMTSTSTSIKIPGIRRPSPSNWKQWVLNIFTDLLRVGLNIDFELIGLFSYLLFFYVFNIVSYLFCYSYDKGMWRKSKKLF